MAVFTTEYPPFIYGGAGVHVEYLSRELSRLVPVEVRCFGDQDVTGPNLRVKGYGPWSEAKVNTDSRFGGALDAIHNGIDLRQYRKNPAVDALVKRGVGLERPFVLFVGRITRQKGIIHLVNAIPEIDPTIQVVLCAAALRITSVG